MNENDYYKALKTKDSRFDGTFYVGVITTGIYCRPICTARLPKQSNCRFFKTAEAAEKEFFRPCLKCRPELAPGQAPIDKSQRIAELLTQAEEDSSVESIAKLCGLSTRQIRRVIQKEFGVSPIEFILTRRLLLAKQLLTDTSLPIIDIAFASGFSSLRRFNDAFKKRYRIPPSHFRKNSPKRDLPDTIQLLLAYRPPYHWQHFLNFMNQKALDGVELVRDGCYARTIQIGNHKGWISAMHAPDKNALAFTISSSLIPVLSCLLARLRNLFDLNAHPHHIHTHLSSDRMLATIVKQSPGLRVPGAFDGFELAVRAILGQQVSVRAATVIACRFVNAFGEPIATPFPELTHLSPTPKTISHLSIDEIASKGIIRTRSQSIILLAKEIDSNRLRLDKSINPEATIEQLVQIPGIGKWTAHYIAMRALKWPDAFPKEDIGLRKKLGLISPKQAEKLSQAWRPWRSYALLHLWNS